MPMHPYPKYFVLYRTHPDPTPYVFGCRVLVGLERLVGLGLGTRLICILLLTVVYRVLFLFFFFTPSHVLSSHCSRAPSQ